MTAFIEFIRALFTGLATLTRSNDAPKNEPPHVTASRLLMVAIVFLGVALLLVLWKMTSP
jgi:hypothetical protein